MATGRGAGGARANALQSESMYVTSWRVPGAILLVLCFPFFLCTSTHIKMFITSAVLRLECSLDSLSIDSAHVIYVSEGYDVAV